MQPWASSAPPRSRFGERAGRAAGVGGSIAGALHPKPRVAPPLAVHGAWSDASRRAMSQQAHVPSPTVLHTCEGPARVLLSPALSHSCAWRLAGPRCRRVQCAWRPAGGVGALAGPARRCAAQHLRQPLCERLQDPAWQVLIDVCGHGRGRHAAASRSLADPARRTSHFGAPTGRVCAIPCAWACAGVAGLR